MGIRAFSEYTECSQEGNHWAVGIEIPGSFIKDDAGGSVNGAVNYLLSLSISHFSRIINPDSW